MTDSSRAGFRISNSFPCYPPSEPARFLAPAWLSGPARTKLPWTYLPDWREIRACAAALLIRLGLANYPSCGGLPHRHPLRTCFCGVAKSSMFAEMPLDNRTVDQFAALAAVAGSLRPLEVCRRRNDLMFRRGWQFCNIEPKICQYD